MSSLLWIARRGKAPEPRAERRAFEGAQWLVAESGPAVLRRIVDGDPLFLERRCAEFLEQRALCIDLERLLARSFARVARDAMRYEGEPGLATWLAGCIARSADELIAQDVQAARDGEAYDESDRVPDELESSIGIEREHARRAAVVLNHLPDVVRRDFFAVMIRGANIDAHARAFGVTHESVESRVRLALRTVSTCMKPRDGGAT